MGDPEKGGHEKGRVHRVIIRPAPGPNSVIVMQWSQELLPLLQVTGVGVRFLSPSITAAGGQTRPQGPRASSHPGVVTP